MKIDYLKTKGTWNEINDSCRVTVNKESNDKEPSSIWKRKLLLSEHSPIRQLIIKWKWSSLYSWVSVHFVRHKFGIEHWVRTQRTDRTGVDRGTLSQNTFIEHECEANAQAIITISRKRLCNKASAETREAWTEMLNKLKEKEPELVSVCVADCIYRGHCYEIASCQYHKTKDFQNELLKYREGINQYEQM